MAVLFITEFAGRGTEANGAATPHQAMPEKANQVVAIGASSVQSAALNAKTNVVRISADSPCSVQFGVNPTATLTTMRVPANVVEYLSVPAGVGYKIAVIANP